jgi:CheY-like chemotaxis protein
VNSTAAARILIVEDERLIALDLQRRLTRLGYSVVALAASGVEAIQKALALHPDVVLMDIRLQGDMDGVEAAQQIQASAAIPVVFMTAYVDEETHQRVRATSRWGCLYKPFTPHQVQSTLEHVLSGQPPDDAWAHSRPLLEQPLIAGLQVGFWNDIIENYLYGITAMKRSAYTW